MLMLFKDKIVFVEKKMNPKCFSGGGEGGVNN
jgi:hypothetical protein